jgi:hypothetical protein
MEITMAETNLVKWGTRWLSQGYPSSDPTHWTSWATGRELGARPAIDEAVIRSVAHLSGGRPRVPGADHWEAYGAGGNLEAMDGGRNRMYV